MCLIVVGKAGGARKVGVHQNTSTLFDFRLVVMWILK